MKSKKSFKNLEAGEKGYSGLIEGKDAVLYINEKKATEVKEVSYRLESKEVNLSGDWKKGERTYTGPFFVNKKDKEMAIQFPDNSGKEYIFDAEERESCGLLLSYNKDGITELIYAVQGKGMYLLSDIMAVNVNSEVRDHFVQMLFKCASLMEGESGKE